MAKNTRLRHNSKNKPAAPQKHLTRQWAAAVDKTRQKLKFFLQIMVIVDRTFSNFEAL